MAGFVASDWPTRNAISLHTFVGGEVAFGLLSCFLCQLIQFALFNFCFTPQISLHSAVTTHFAFFTLL